MEVPINSTFEQAQLDLSFLDDYLDVDTTGYRALEVPVLSDRKTWSSLAAVLFLHAALTCFLWISPKPTVSSRDWIEVKLVSFQGSPDATVEAAQGSLGAREQPRRPLPRSQKTMSCPTHIRP